MFAKKALNSAFPWISHFTDTTGWININNTYYYNHLMTTIRNAIRNNTWEEVKNKLLNDLSQNSLF